LANPDGRTLRLQAWTTIGPPRCTQSITVKLPPASGADKAVLCDAEPTGRFVVLADEATPITLLFAVNPEKRQVPLSCLSVCSLSLPVVSVSTLTATGQEHYSDERETFVAGSSVVRQGADVADFCCLMFLRCRGGATGAVLLSVSVHAPATGGASVFCPNLPLHEEAGSKRCGERPCPTRGSEGGGAAAQWPGVAGTCHQPVQRNAVLAR